METKTNQNNKTDPLNKITGKEFNKIRVMVSGLPGNMATLISNKIVKQEDMELFNYALTGEGIIEKQGNHIEIGNKKIILIEPVEHLAILKSTQKIVDVELPDILEEEVQTSPMLPPSDGIIVHETQSEIDLIVDFTAPPVKGQPSPAVENAKLYSSMNIPFVMGSTTSTEDVEEIKKIVKAHMNVAIYAPNMAIPIIIFQDMMEYAANKYPNALGGYLINLIESHQAAKKDTSGTMKAVMKSIKKLGIPTSEEDIQMIRDPGVQKTELGVPEEFLGGHAYHWYNLISQDQTVRLSFSHCVDGRDVYTEGTLAAIRFLNKKIQENVRGKIFSMQDVLSGQ